MKNISFLTVLLGVVFCGSNGCERPAYTDVTASPQYNFSPFVGSIWKTKVRVALIDVRLYTGRHETVLFPPDAFDAAAPHYQPVASGRILSVLPIGTHFRIERLLKDNAPGDLLLVGATLRDTPNFQKAIFVDRTLLSKNRYMFDAWTFPSTNWGVDPDLLEK